MMNVSILGCGWVGSALKDHLQKQHDVKCLSRDSTANHEEGLYLCNVLVIAIPPRENYLEVLSSTLENVTSSTTQVIFLSSISFYSGKPLVVQGEAVVKAFHKKSVILRLGGLMGYDRIAGKYTAGKTVQENTTTNYVYRDDVVGIITSVITENIEDEIFDVVAPIQTTKQEIYAKNAQKFGFEQTTFLSSLKIGRSFSQHKLYTILKYRFLREDVLNFWE